MLENPRPTDDQKLLEVVEMGVPYIESEEAKERCVTCVYKP